MIRAVPVADLHPSVVGLLADHQHPAATHSDLDAARCSCRHLGTPVAAPPRSTGDICMSCGGMTVRTGTCHTCTSCGTSGGCG